MLFCSEECQLTKVEEMQELEKHYFVPFNTMTGSGKRSSMDVKTTGKAKSYQLLHLGGSSLGVHCTLPTFCSSSL